MIMGFHDMMKDKMLIRESHLLLSAEIRLDAMKNTINLGKRIVDLVKVQVEIKQMTFAFWLLKPWLNLILS